MCNLHARMILADQIVDGRFRFALTVVAERPIPTMLVLVEMAENHDDAGHRVEHREDPDAHHELFEFFGFAACLGAQHIANAKQRIETGQQKENADDQVRAER